MTGYSEKSMVIKSPTDFTDVLLKTFDCARTQASKKSVVICAICGQKNSTASSLPQISQILTDVLR